MDATCENTCPASCIEPRRSGEWEDECIKNFMLVKIFSGQWLQPAKQGKNTNKNLFIWLWWKKRIINEWHAKISLCHRFPCYKRHHSNHYYINQEKKTKKVLTSIDEICRSFWNLSLGHADDDRINETSVQLRQAQGTFPSVFGRAIFHLVDMLEDENIIEHGASGKLERIVSTLAMILSSKLYFSFRSCSESTEYVFTRRPNATHSFLLRKTLTERTPCKSDFILILSYTISSIADSITSNSSSFNVVLNWYSTTICTLYFQLCPRFIAKYDPFSYR